MTRRLVGVVVAVLVVATAVVVGGRANGAVGFEDATFGGYASATAVHVDALQTGAPGPRVADLEVGYSAASADSGGLTTPIHNEMQLVAQPAQPGRNSYGRGSAVELGVSEDVPVSSDQQAAVLSGLVEAAAPPTADPAPRQIEIDNLDPLVYASAASGDAAAAYDRLACLTDGQMGFGRAHAAKVQLLNAGPENADGSMRGPVLAIDSPPDVDPAGPERNAVDSRSATYLVRNPNGTFGVVSETRMTIAPVSLLTDPATNLSAVTVEVLGEWVLRVHASGLAPATVAYGPDPATAPATKVARVLSNGVEAAALTFQQLLGGEGLEVPGLPLLRVALGEDPRAIATPGTAPDSASAPTMSVTEGAAAVDVASIQLLGFGAPISPTHVADIRLGHMEVRATVPAGGIACSDAGATTTTMAPSTTTSSSVASTTSTTTAPSCPDFSGSATGTVLHADALQVAAEGPRLADVELGFSGASTDSGGLATTRQNENQVVFQPARPGKRSYGLGSGAEIGLATRPPVTEEQQQLMLAGRSTAEAPPDQSPPPKEIGTGDALSPLVFADLLSGESRAAFDPSDNLTVPGDMAFGRASVANVDLLNGGTTVGPDGFSGPLLEVGANTGGPEREASDSRSRTFLEPIGGGRYGLVSETRMTIAPVTIGMASDSTDDDVTIEVLGEWVLRLRATGQGPATVQYGPADPPADNSTPVVRIFQGNQLVDGLTLQDLLGQPGLVVDASPLLRLAVGEDPRAIAAPGTAPDPTSSPTLTSTGGSAALDVVSLQVLVPAPGDGPRLADVRLGHMEVRAAVPAGGIRACLGAAGATTTTTIGATTTTAPTGGTTTTAPGGGATTTTTAPGGSGTTTTTAPTGGGTSTTTAPATTTTSPLGGSGATTSTTAPTGGGGTTTTAAPAPTTTSAVGGTGATTSTTSAAGGSGAGTATTTTAPSETTGPPTQVGGAQFLRPDASSGTSGTARARGEGLPRTGAGASTSRLLGLGACVLALGVALASVGRRLGRRARAS
jgi:hypothetical protein